MSTDLARRNASGDLPSTQASEAITQALEGLKAIRTFVKNEFIEGVDFGKIPGCGDKPTLFLPGGQKATMYFNAYPTYKVRESDLGAGHVEYRVRCLLVSRTTGMQIGEGLGCASTREKKFQRGSGGNLKTCPTCGKAAVMKSKDKPEYFCWRKKDGCGATFRLDNPALKAPAAEPEAAGDPYEVRNTVLKMGKKRAHVDAAMTLGCLSELFTQDIEDTFQMVEVRESARHEEPEPYHVNGEVIEQPPTQRSAPGLFTKEHVKVTEKFNAWVANECGRLNRQWADQWEERLLAAMNDGLPVPAKVDDLVNPWQAKNHLLKWAVATGRLDPEIKAEAAKTRQSDAYVAWVASRSDEEKAAVKAEMGEYVERLRGEKATAIYRKNPELAPAGYAEEAAEADHGDAYEGPDSLAEAHGNIDPAEAGK